MRSADATHNLSNLMAGPILWFGFRPRLWGVPIAASHIRITGVNAVRTPSVSIAATRSRANLSAVNATTFHHNDPQLNSPMGAEGSSSMLAPGRLISIAASNFHTRWFLDSRAVLSWLVPLVRSLREIRVDERHHRGAFADRAAHALYRPRPHVADRVLAGHV